MDKKEKIGFILNTHFSQSKGFTHFLSRKLATTRKRRAIKMLNKQKKILLLTSTKKRRVWEVVR